jgi:LmbE family N-acetylglucosaminyl deacetylase
MKFARIFALLMVFTLNAVSQSDTPKLAPKPDERFKVDVLLIVAHPDDETGVSPLLAQLMDQGKHVAAVYLTRGEAGHNNMGPERGPSLGAVREMELRHAMTGLGVQDVWFLGGKDTPSQDVRQSLANWQHGARLEEVVRIVRLTRPAVILTWLPAFFIGENHGDHQAAGVIATEAFDVAGDPSIFPAQLAIARHVNETWLEGLRPWQPEKIYYFSDASDDKQFKDKGPAYSTTAISPTRKIPYWRLAMDEFRFHRTQYRSYIEKLDSMNEAQLAKLAAPDQDGWAGPVSLIFGKSNVGSNVTDDILAGVKPEGIDFVRPESSRAPATSGLSMRIGGPWAFYEDFRREHALEGLPRAAVPEISIAAGTTLQVPLVLQNEAKDAANVSIAVNLPEGWTRKDPAQTYRLLPGDKFPILLEFVTGAKSDKILELNFDATSSSSKFATVNMRVRVGSGGLPQ